MLARAIVGDASVALDGYAAFHQRLLDELGASPSAETERLHAAILQGCPLGAWPRGSGPARSESTPGRADRPLVGRDHELRLLEQALEDAAGGRPTLLVVTGEAGIGKSRLLDSVRTCARGRFHCLDANGRESDRDLPFQLLADAIRSLDVSPETFQASLGPYADAFAELAPELTSSTISAPGTAMSQVTRRRRFEGFLHLVRSLAQARPVLLLVDDFHWADPSTVDTLTFCLARLHGARALCVLALRTGEADASAEILARLPNARVMSLSPLSADDARQLIDDVAPDLAERIVAESGGIPFYVVELARAARAPDGLTAVPSGIHRAIQQRVRSVSARGRRLLDAAAVLGDGFGLDAATALVELPRPVALDALEDLVRRQLLVELRIRSPGYRFAHDLIRRSIDETMSATRRRFLHGRAADLRLGVDPAVVGRHALQAGRPGQAVALFRSAGDAALARFAMREAESLFEAALAAADEARIDKRGRVELLDRLGRARGAHGNYVGASEAHRAALALTGEAADAARQKLRLGWIAFYQREPERAASLAREAAAEGDVATCGEGFLLQAKVSHSVGRTDRAAEQVTEAGRLAGPEAQAEVRALEVAIANHRARFGEAILRFEGAVDALHRGGLVRPLATLMLHGAIAFAARGDYTRAMAILAESATFNRQAGAEHLEARIHNTLGTIYRELGQPERATDLYLEAAALAERTDLGEALAHALVGLADLDLEAGNLGEARRLVAAADPIVHDPLIGYSWRIRMRWELVRGRLATMDGHRDEALHAAEAALTQAKETSSRKYEVLALLQRGEVLGPRDGGLADLRSAWRVARRLDAPPLVHRAGLALSYATSGVERTKLLRVVTDTAEALAAPLADDLRRTFLARHLTGR
jgi:tetratricopeptide (TPR) repeat protein